jgi:hypothetical protein
MSSTALGAGVRAPVRGEDLFALLPAIYRLRDAERAGEPTRALIAVLATQRDALAKAVERQYDDWFIETCDDEIVPVIGALVGIAFERPRARGPAEAAWRRRQVASALRDRRRRGAFSLLADLAREVTGWPATALEQADLAFVTAPAALPSAGGHLCDAGDAEATATLGTPFARSASLPSARRSGPRSPARANPDGVVVWLWRLRAERRERQQAVEDEHGDHERSSTHRGARAPYYHFDPLGDDVQLCSLPAGRGVGALPRGTNGPPVAITREQLARRLRSLYGEGGSLCVYERGRAVAAERVLVGDLGRWRPAPAERVTIDPLRGRLALHKHSADLAVSYGRLTSAELGGGSYARTPPAPVRDALVVTVGTGHGDERTIGAALARWQAVRAEHPHAVIEIHDDRLYPEHLRVALAAGQTLELRTAVGRQPAIVPGEAQAHSHHADRAGAGFEIGAPRHGHVESAVPPAGRADAPGGELVIEGLLLAGVQLALAGPLRSVALRHCTLGAGGAERRAPTLVLRGGAGEVRLERCLAGAIAVAVDPAASDPPCLGIVDTVLDGGHGAALAGADGGAAWASLSLARATVFGEVRVHEVARVADSILTDALHSDIQQRGEVTHSYVPDGSRTPGRRACQPDGVRARVRELRESGELPADEGEAAVRRELARVRPRFDGRHRTDPGYARLVADAAPELTQGACDGGELGAQHLGWAAVRIENLRRQLTDLTPVGMQIDIVLAS